MIELEFLGRSGDGLSIIFTDEEGERYSADITDELRSALRRGHPRTEGARNSSTNTSLRPRDIQALLREGISAAEISEQQDMELSAITKYESPVLAERAWIISKAQLARVGEGPDAPVLEDLVIDRLAARGVDHTTLSWAALRRPGEEWEVSLTFTQGAIEQTATWNVTSDGNAIKAIDQEAQWLTETASPLAPVSAFFPPRVHEFKEEVAEVEDLLEDANSRRGKRQPIIEEVEEIGDIDPQPATNIRAFFSARPIPTSTEIIDDESDGDDAGPESARDQTAPETDETTKPLQSLGEVTEPVTSTSTSRTTLTAPKQDVPLIESPKEPEEIAETAAEIPPVEDTVKRKKSRKRQPVPTWDEIVFGSKND